MGDVITWILVVGAIMGVPILLGLLIRGGMEEIFKSSLFNGGKKNEDSNETFESVKMIGDDFAKAIKDKSQDLGDMIRQKRKNLDPLLKNKVTTKIEKIEKLVLLKNDGHLNDEEFDYLKSEIMKR